MRSNANKAAELLAAQIAEAHELVDQIAADLFPKARKAQGQTLGERLRPLAANVRQLKTVANDLTRVTDKAIGLGPWSEGSGNPVSKRLQLIVTDREIDKVRSVGWEAQRAHDAANKVLRLLGLRPLQHDALFEKLERVLQKLQQHTPASR